MTATNLTPTDNPAGPDPADAPTDGPDPAADDAGPDPADVPAGLASPDPASEAGNPGDTPAGLFGLDADGLAALAAEGIAGLEAPPARPAVRHTTLADHAGAIVHQARLLTVADLFDCGPGIASALEDLALAMTGTERRGQLGPAQLKGAALDLVDITRATQPHRTALDARPRTRPAYDGPHEAYPRGVFTVPPRYSHADRRSPMIASIYGMAEFLTPPTHSDTI